MLPGATYLIKMMHSLSFRRFLFILIAAIFIVLATVRFLFLDVSPPGFFIDEAGSAAHIVCLRETGMNCWKESFTLYSTTWGVGRIGPIHQYVGWFWTEIFGSSIASFRSLSALFGFAAILLLVYFSYRVGEKRVAFYTALSAFLLPWSFHSSRIAWDPPMAPFFVVLIVLSIYFTASSKCWVLFALSAALSANLAGLSYAPVYAHVAFLLLLLFLLQRHFFPMPFLRWCVIGVLALAIFGIIRFADTSAVEGRASEIAIWADDARNPTAGKPWNYRVIQFLLNTADHFEPSYLFTKGEFNLRHTTQRFGIFSWLDLFAFLSALCIYFLSRFWKTLRLPSAELSPHKKLALLGFVGYTTAAMAAALTWDSIPHGLRSLSGWPFAAILSGVALSYICRFRIFKGLALVVAVSFVTSFANYYFGQFRNDAAWWFDTDVTDALHDFQQTGDRETFREFLIKRHYSHLAQEYFYIAYLKEKPSIE